MYAADFHPVAVTIIKTVPDSDPLHAAEKKSPPVVFQLVRKGCTDDCHPWDVIQVRTILEILPMDVTKKDG